MADLLDRLNAALGGRYAARTPHSSGELTISERNAVWSPEEPCHWQPGRLHVTELGTPEPAPPDPPRPSNPTTFARRHVPILAYRPAAVSLLQARPEGGTDVRVGPAAEELAWGERYHAKIFVSAESLRLIREHGGGM